MNKVQVFLLSSKSDVAFHKLCDLLRDFAQNDYDRLHISRHILDLIENIFVTLIPRFNFEYLINIALLTNQA